MVAGVAATNATVNGQTIQQSLIITAALPQVVIAASLYLILGFAALIVSLHPPGTPFTLAGLLMMRSKLTALRSFSHLYDGENGTSSGEGLPHDG